MLVVLWTRHPEIIEEFKSRFSGRTPIFTSVIFFTAMDKPGLLAEEPEPVEADAEEAKTPGMAPRPGLSSATINGMRKCGGKAAGISAFASRMGL